jgi:hypothetical protein
VTEAAAEKDENKIMLYLILDLIREPLVNPSTENGQAQPALF